MTKNLFLFEEKDNLDVTALTINNNVLYYGFRKDLLDIKVKFPIDKPGIYILMSKGRLYVGQSSVSVYTRLSIHEREKDWWDKMIIFTTKDGFFEKTMVEYIEAYLIQSLMHEGASLDNDTSGNSIHVDEFTKLKSKSIINDLLLGIYEVLNIELKTEYKDSDSKEVNSSTSGLVTLKVIGTDKEYSDKSALLSLVKLLKDYATDITYFSKLLDDSVLEATSSAPLVTDMFLSEKKDFIHIHDSLYLYKKLNEQKVDMLINNISSLLDLEITVSR